MKKEKIKNQLQEIYNELAYIRGVMQNVSNQMQELRDAIGSTQHEDSELSVRELYEHPWDQHIRQRSITDRDCDESPETKKYYEAVTARLGFSGGTATTQGPSH
jgi:hypothetical protein